MQVHIVVYIKQLKRKMVRPEKLAETGEKIHVKSSMKCEKENTSKIFNILNKTLITKLNN